MKKTVFKLSALLLCLVLLFGLSILPVSASTDTDTDALSVGYFYVFTVLLGILVPAGLLVLGILLARSKKTRGNEHWYGLAAASGLWILSSVLLLILASV